MMVRRTRKINRHKSRPYEIHVKYLKKQKGGRLHNITTFQSVPSKSRYRHPQWGCLYLDLEGNAAVFRSESTTKGGACISNTAVCTPEEASAKLRVINTLKSPETSDDYIHVLKSIVDNQDLIIKIQEPGQMLNAELMIHNHLHGCNNIIRYICDFNCLLDITWNKPIEKPRFLCDATGESKHIIVMEYINSDLAQFLDENSNIENELFCSLVKQSGFALLDFHINKFVCHNDINRGNILLQIDNDIKDLTYTICGRNMVVNTLGHEVIYIDFQRGHILDAKEEDSDVNNLSNKNTNTNTNTNSMTAADSITAKINARAARDEISLLYELMSKWTQHIEYKKRLQELMQFIMKSKTTEEMLMHIDEFC